MKNKLASFLLPIILSGCATQTYLVNGDTENEPNHKKSEHFFVEGIGQKKTINAAQICKGAENIIKVQTEQSVIDVLFSAVSWGIYTPRTTRIYCKPTQELSMDDSETVQEW